MFQAENATKAQRAARPVSELALVAVMRLAALFALFMAIIIASRLIGLGLVQFAPMRFDLIAPGPRTVLLCTGLCAAAAGLGQWSVARWGAMLWAAACASLFYMHALRTEVYGDAGMLIVVIGSIIAIQLATYAWFLLSRRALALR